eukprot:151007_1
MPFNPTSNCHTCAFCGRIFPLITHAAPTRPIERSCATTFAFRSTRNSIYGLAHPPALHPCHSHPRCTVTFPRASPSTGTCHAASGEGGGCHRARRARASPHGPARTENRRAAPAALRSCVVQPPTATAWRRSASHHIRRHFIHAILTPVVLALSLALLLRLELVTLLPVKVVVVIEPAARAPARTETAAPLRPRSVHA